MKVLRTLNAQRSEHGARDASESHRSARNLFLLKSILCATLCASTAVCVQAQNQRQSVRDESWRATIDTRITNGNPSRTTESYTKSNDRIIDERKIEILGINGHYEPFSESQAETVKVDATTARTVVRNYTWDGNGRRTLAQVIEEESHTTATGETRTERRTSNSDLNGNFQVVQREIVSTRKISPEIEERKSTVYRADSYGGFTQAQQTQELKTHNAGDSVAVKRINRIPDGNGNWKVSDVTETITADDGKNRTSEERFFRSDLNDRLYETSRRVSKEAETATGEKKSTVETFSIYAPGYFDSRLHLHQRVITIQKKRSDGEISGQEIEQPSVGNPSDGPKVIARTKYVVQYTATGTESTRTVEIRDINGKLDMVSVETRKLDPVCSAEKPTTPGDKHQ